MASPKRQKTTAHHEEAKMMAMTTTTTKEKMYPMDHREELQRLMTRHCFSYNLGVHADNCPVSMEAIPLESLFQYTLPTLGDWTLDDIMMAIEGDDGTFTAQSLDQLVRDQLEYAVPASALDSLSQRNIRLVFRIAIHTNGDAFVVDTHNDDVSALRVINIHVTKFGTTTHVTAGRMGHVDENGDSRFFDVSVSEDAKAIVGTEDDKDSVPELPTDTHVTVLVQVPLKTASGQVHDKPPAKTENTDGKLKETTDEDIRKILVECLKSPVLDPDHPRNQKCLVRDDMRTVMEACKTLYRTVCAHLQVDPIEPCYNAKQYCRLTEGAWKAKTVSMYAKLKNVMDLWNPVGTVCDGALDSFEYDAAPKLNGLLGADKLKAQIKTVIGQIFKSTLLPGDYILPHVDADAITYDQRDLLKTMQYVIDPDAARPVVVVFTVNLTSVDGLLPLGAVKHMFRNMSLIAQPKSCVESKECSPALENPMYLRAVLFALTHDPVMAPHLRWTLRELKDHSLMGDYQNDTVTALNALRQRVIADVQSGQGCYLYHLSERLLGVLRQSPFFDSDEILTARKFNSLCTSLNIILREHTPSASSSSVDTASLPKIYHDLFNVREPSVDALLAPDIQDLYAEQTRALRDAENAARAERVRRYQEDFKRRMASRPPRHPSLDIKSLPDSKLQLYAVFYAMTHDPRLQSVIDAKLPDMYQESLDSVNPDKSIGSNSYQLLHMALELLRKDVPKPAHAKKIRAAVAVQGSLPTGKERAEYLKAFGLGLIHVLNESKLFRCREPIIGNRTFNALQTAFYDMHVHAGKVLVDHPLIYQELFLRSTSDSDKRVVNYNYTRFMYDVVIGTDDEDDDVKMSDPPGKRQRLIDRLIG